MKTEKLFGDAAEKLLLEGKLTAEFIENGLPEVVSQFKNFISELHLDFDLCFPEKFNEKDRRIIIGSSISFLDYEIAESTKVNSYSLHLKVTATDWLALSQLSPIEPFLRVNLMTILRKSEELFQDEKLDLLKNKFDGVIERWNSNVFVVQERTVMMSRQLMNHLEGVLGYSEESIIMILNDYYERMNKSKLNNLKRFERKMSQVLSGLDEEQSPWKNYLTYLFNEISNGGANIQSTKDIYNNYMLLETIKEN